MKNQNRILEELIKAKVLDSSELVKLTDIDLHQLNNELTVLVGRGFVEVLFPETKKLYRVKDRISSCSACHNFTRSETDLPFFKVNGFRKKGMDEYYCGCRGWD